MKCIFFNVELDVNNINSLDEKLGIPRYYEKEALRLIDSIIKEVPEIKIFVILFRPTNLYQEETLRFLEEYTTILIPKLTQKHQDEIKNFYSGFWYIPLTGLLMENTYNKLTSDSHLLTQDGDIPTIPERALKLDSDMVMLDNIYQRFLFGDTNPLDKTVVGYYDKDYGSDCVDREKYGIENMSNTCLIYSKLSKNIYGAWYRYLIDYDDGTDDLFEEVAFDIVHPYKNNQPLKNFQIGENYLCLKDLDRSEADDILFYHQRLDEITYNQIKSKLFLARKGIK